jgi:hypothetical protein
MLIAAETGSGSGEGLQRRHLSVHDAHNSPEPTHAVYIGLSNADDPDGAGCGRDRAEQRERSAASASVSPRMHTTHQDDSTQCIYEARVRTIQSRWCWFRHRLIERWRSTESASIHACTPRVYTLLPSAVYKERSTKSVLTQGDESPCVSGRSTESASIHACTPRVYTLSQSAAARQSPRWTSLRGVVRVRYIKQSRSPC